jgi:phosphomannomutase
MTSAFATTDTIPQDILRSYDIRGIVPDQLSPAVARQLGRAFGSRVVRAGGRRVSVGRDGRLSSLMLEEALVEGLAACGLAVERIGLGPTPMLYYADAVNRTDGAVMLTGSHNPSDYNGMKIVLGGKPFYGDDIQDLRRIAADEDYVPLAAGTVQEISVFGAYIERLVAELTDMRPLNVVWDCGNGAAGEVVQHLTARLPGRHTVLFGEIDGRFPNHHPDPTEPHNLVDLQEAVAAQQADLGIAFDGDGDRIGVVDAGNRIVWGDQMLLLFARDVLARQPGAPIIADVKASQVLFDGVAAAGGKPVMYRTGHSLIKSKMKEIGAPLAGEMSGHIFFADRYYGYDDALYAAVRLLRLVSAGRPGWLAAQIDELPKLWNTPELRIDCPDSEKFMRIAALKKTLQAEGICYNDVDGMRVGDASGWWLLRASNTQPILVARCEAQTEAGLAMVQQELQRRLATIGISYQP